MKLLFIQGGSRVRKTTNNRFYVDGNFNNEIWKRYASYADELTVILRKENKIYEEDVINTKFNIINTDILNLILVEDLYKPKKNYFNILKRMKIKKEIKNAVLSSDKIIIRSIGNFYTNTTLKYAKKYNKQYLIEVTGFAFEVMWYHSFVGKFIAFFKEIKLKRSLLNAPYVVYVTEKELQKRYPSRGKIIGCSDVEIEMLDENYLKNKKDLLIKNKDTFIIGTAGFLNVKFKAQQDVIKAIYKLKKNNSKIRIIYEIVGSGSSKRLEKIIEKYSLQDSVKILGVLPHNKIFDWYDHLDIYIHPSHTEGLCRCIVEAMSRACPVICSDAGGNKELVDNEYVFKIKDINQIVNILNNINKEELIQQAEKNFIKSQKYEKNYLDKKRDEFYNNFILD